MYSVTCDYIYIYITCKTTNVTQCTVILCRTFLKQVKSFDLNLNVLFEIHAQMNAVPLNSPNNILFLCLLLFSFVYFTYCPALQLK